MRRITHSEMRIAIIHLTDEKLYTATEIKHFIEDYYAGQLFVNYNFVDDYLREISVPDIWNYFNAIRVNGVSYYWFNGKAYNQMRTAIDHRRAIKKSVKLRR